MTIYGTLKMDRCEKTVVVTLDRPDEANGVNGLMAKELAEVAQLCDEDSSIRVVVLTATGRFFCAGGDVKAMAGFGDHTALEIKRLADDVHSAISTFSRMRAPLIVAVNGIAAGGGFGLAMSGDLVIASDSASFTMSYSSVGLSPDGSSSYFLPRLIGLRRTQELMFTNRTLGAQEALDWGLVNKISPHSALLDEAMRLADTVIGGAPDSNASIKKLLMATFGNGLETQMEIEGRYISECAGSKNGREGILAFTQKRRPRFE